MIVLEWLFLTIAPCDAAEPWQLGSQDAATPMMQGIIDLHHDIFFFLILILVFVSRILVRALWHFHYNKCRNSWVPGITWTISTLCCLLDLCSECLVEHAECAGEEGSSNAQLDLDLTLRPPGPTAEEIERELSSFLSSFGNRGVTSSVLQNTKIKLQLDVASPAKLLKIRELMRDIQSRPVPAFQARDALLKALAQWERDQTRDPWGWPPSVGSTN